MRNVTDKSFTESQTTQITVFWKSCRLWNNVGKYCTAGQATDDNMAHAHDILDT